MLILKKPPPFWKKKRNFPSVWAVKRGLAIKSRSRPFSGQKRRNDDQFKGGEYLAVGGIGFGGEKKPPFGKSSIPEVARGEKKRSPFQLRGRFMRSLACLGKRKRKAASKRRGEGGIEPFKVRGGSNGSEGSFRKSRGGVFRAVDRGTFPQKGKFKFTTSKEVKKRWKEIRHKMTQREIPLFLLNMLAKMPKKTRESEKTAGNGLLFD